MNVFCYGTLMRGFGNYKRLLEGTSEFLGVAETEPIYTLVNLGGFPGVLTGGTTSIRGEVFKVNNLVRARLDQLEGHPNFYKRTSITLKDGTKAEIYILNTDGRPNHYQVIESGDYRSFTGIKP